MKTKYSFEIMDLDDGLVAVPIGNGAENFHGVLKVNDTAVAILNLMKEETTEEEIVTAIMTEYSGEKNQIQEYVHSFIETLNTEGLVD